MPADGRAQQGAVETEQEARYREQQALLDASQARDGAQRQLQQMQDEAQGRYERALRARELRVFGYRLALTLPLLLLGAWFYARKGFRYHHMVWHLLIDLAVAAHFAGIVFYLY